MLGIDGGMKKEQRRVERRGAGRVGAGHGRSRAAELCVGGSESGRGGDGGGRARGKGKWAGRGNRGTDEKTCFTCAVLNIILVKHFLRKDISKIICIHI